MITSERSEWSSYYQSYIGRLDDIQTALKSFKKTLKKLEYIFMTILGLAEPAWPDSTVTLFDGLLAYFSESMKYLLTIIRLAESFKMMNRPDPTRP